MDRLPLYLAAFQGVAGSGWRRRPGRPAAGAGQDTGTAGRDGSHELRVAELLEMLAGFPAPAGVWEADILPARLSPYHRLWLDTALQGELVWFGCGRGRIGFSPREAEIRSDSSG